MEKPEKLERRGACGAFNADPRLFSEKEQETYGRFYDGCNEGNEPYRPTVQEMVEAGIISLDSQGNPM